MARYPLGTRCTQNVPMGPFAVPRSQALLQYLLKQALLPAAKTMWSASGKATLIARACWRLRCSLANDFSGWVLVKLRSIRPWLR